MNKNQGTAHLRLLGFTHARSYTDDSYMHHRNGCILYYTTIANTPMWAASYSGNTHACQQYLEVLNHVW